MPPLFSLGVPRRYLQGEARWSHLVSPYLNESPLPRRTLRICAKTTKARLCGCPFTMMESVPTMYGNLDSSIATPIHIPMLLSSRRLLLDPYLIPSVSIVPLSLRRG